MKCHEVVLATVVVLSLNPSWGEGQTKPRRDTVVTTAVVKQGSGEVRTIHYWRNGDRSRAQTVVKRGKKVEQRTEIITPQWVYELNDLTKTVQKHPAAGFSSAPHDYILHQYDPVWWGREMKRIGKHVSSDRLGDTSCAVYESPYGKLSKGWRMLIWVRRSNGVAMKEERRTPTGKADWTLEWQWVEIGVAMDEKLFRVPTEYRLADAHPWNSISG